MKKEILQFRNVKLIYHTRHGETTAAENLTFSVHEGEFVPSSVRPDAEKPPFCPLPQVF